MPAVSNRQHPGVVDFGDDVLAIMRQIGQRRQDIERGQCRSGLLDAPPLLDDLQANLLKQLVLQFNDLFFGSQYLGFVLLEFRGDIALGVGQGLATLVVVGDLVDVAFGDFEIITEDSIVADFQIGDAGAFPLTLLQLDDPPLPFTGYRSQLVQLGMIAVPDQSTLAEHEGGIIVDGCRDEL